MGLLQSAFQQQAAKIVYRRGLGYEQRQLHDRAIAAFTQAIAKGYVPSAEALVHRGINHIKGQDIEGAIADFESVIQQAQSQYRQSKSDTSSYFLAQALFNRGSLRLNKGDSEAAWIDWAAAIDGCSTYAQPYYHRALLSIDRRDYDKALFDLNAAIAIEPTMAVAYLQRGNLRYQLGDIPGAAIDWQYAICNDFTLESAKQSLEKLQYDAYQDQLSQVLARPLAEKGLTAKVQHKRTNSRGDCLDIYVHRETGTGVNYHALPDLIRQHLVPLQLDSISCFRVIGQVGEATSPEWEQSYDLYKHQPCPPSRWSAASLAVVLFLPLAIPAFIQAASVKRAYKKGQYVEALNASNLVSVFSIASSIPFCFFMLLSFSYASYGSAKTQVALSHSKPSVHVVSCQKTSALCVKQVHKKGAE